MTSTSGSSDLLSERPQDDPNIQDSSERFAADLRTLKLSAGDPTLLALESRTGISKSVLSEAFSGRRLPTEKTVRHLAAELGDDPARWLDRRARLLPSAAKVASTGEPGSPGTPKHASKAGRSIALVAATATVSIALTSLVWWNVLQSREHYWQTLKSPLAGNNFLEVADGVDPMQTECREDKVVADIGTRLEDTVQVEMLYSNSCMGVWGRVTLLNGQPEGSVLAMRIYPADDPQSSRSQERTAENVNSLYTPLLIEPDVEARVCGIATLTVDDEVTELGPAMCI